jgi:hypothetical protein
MVGGKSEEESGEGDKRGLDWPTGMILLEWGHLDSWVVIGSNGGKGWEFRLL